MRLKLAASVAALGASLLPFGASAAVLSYSAPFGVLDIPFSGTLSLPQFPYDISLLTKVTLEIEATLQADVTVENNTAISGLTAKLLVAGTVGAVGPSGLAPTIVFGGLVDTSDPLAGTDGTAGSGPDFYDFGTVSGMDAASDFILVGFAPFVGAGTFDVDYEGDGGWTITGVGNATTVVDNFGGEGTVKVTYEFIPEPHQYALVGGLGLLGFAAWRRRRS